MARGSRSSAIPHRRSIFASIAPEVMTGELALHGVGMDAKISNLSTNDIPNFFSPSRHISGYGM